MTFFLDEEIICMTLRAAIKFKFGFGFVRLCIEIIGRLLQEFILAMFPCIYR